MTRSSWKAAWQFVRAAGARYRYVGDDVLSVDDGQTIAAWPFDLARRALNRRRYADPLELSLYLASQVTRCLLPVIHRTRMDHIQSIAWRGLP